MLRSPLSVRVANLNTDSHITRLIEDIEFSTAAPGGFDTCSFDLNNLIQRTVRADSLPAEGSALR